MVAAWQARSLDQAYPLVFFDAIRVKIRDEGMVRNKAIHISLGVMADFGAVRTRGEDAYQGSGIRN